MNLLFAESLFANCSERDRKTNRTERGKKRNPEDEKKHGINRRESQRERE